MSSIVAIIPARGGSKRIKDKNIRPFVGLPMIAHSIRTAQRCELFDRIVVSTDSSEIAEVARSWGADVPFIRDRKLADDHVGLEPVVLDAVKRLQSHGARLSYACCVFATAPMLEPWHLKEGFRLMKENGATGSMAVVRFDAPIARALRISASNRLQMFQPEHLMTRSQDLPDAYYDAGQFYWLDVDRSEAQGGFYWKDSVPVILPRLAVLDIDTEEDWTHAEVLYRLRNEALR